jgi:hypothetical protein
LELTKIYLFLKEKMKAKLKEQQLFDYKTYAPGDEDGYLVTWKPPNTKQDVIHKNSFWQVNKGMVKEKQPVVLHQNGKYTPVKKGLYIVTIGASRAVYTKEDFEKAFVVVEG